MTTKYLAHAITTDQVAAVGAPDAEDIMIQAYTMDDDGQTLIYAGQDIWIDTGELSSSDDIDAALTAGGWAATGRGWFESGGFWVAEVSPEDELEITSQDIAALAMKAYGAHDIDTVAICAIAIGKTVAGGDPLVSAAMKASALSPAQAWAECGRVISRAQRSVDDQ